MRWKPCKNTAGCGADGWPPAGSRAATLGGKAGSTTFPISAALAAKGQNALGEAKLIVRDPTMLDETDEIHPLFAGAPQSTEFKKLRKRRFIRSRAGAPYRITREGLVAVRAELFRR